LAALFDAVETIRDFLEQGGQVIVWIAVVICVMWTMIIERLLYLRTEHHRHVKTAFDELSARSDEGSWNFEAIREGEISQLDQRLQTGIPMIRTLASVCPLLGLLGTVTGMIVIFDVMAIVGSSSPRAVAGGVAQATMTTMAGMVGALSGVFPAVLLTRFANQHNESLRTDHQFLVGGSASRLPALPTPVRVAVSLSLAILVTGVLVFGMQRLIETGERALTEETRIYMPDFVRIQREETLETKKPKPDKLPPPEAAPESELVPPMADPDAGGISVNFSNKAINTGVGVRISGASGFDIQDADYMPLVKVAPIYPRRAVSMELEGWVLLRFTVTTIGTIRDVEVVESTNSVFERAAIQAALKFKYKPRVVDGIPVETTGVLHYIRFQFDDSAQ
jgi:protein TonB